MWNQNVSSFNMLIFFVDVLESNREYTHPHPANPLLSQLLTRYNSFEKTGVGPWFFHGTRRSLAMDFSSGKDYRRLSLELFSIFLFFSVTWLSVAGPALGTISDAGSEEDDNAG